MDRKKQRPPANKATKQKSAVVPKSLPVINPQPVPAPATQSVPTALPAPDTQTVLAASIAPATQSVPAAPATPAALPAPDTQTVSATQSVPPVSAVPTVPAASPGSMKLPEGTEAVSRVAWLSQHWLIFLWGVIVTIFTTIVGNIVTQFQGNVSNLWLAIRLYLPFILVLVFITVISLFVIWHHKLSTARKARHTGAMPSSVPSHAFGKPLRLGVVKVRLEHLLSTFVIPIAIPAASMAFALFLLLLVLFRPIWCPALICPLPQVNAPTHPAQASDQNLEAYFLGLQNTSFKVPGILNPHAAHPDPDVAAVRSDTTQSGPYRLFISIHNLHQSGYTLYIDSVAVIVKAVPPLDPLYVKSTPSMPQSGALYHVTYSGQPTGSELDATYDSVPSLALHQFLPHGAEDAIALQIDPAFNLRADLQFSVRITYSFADENQEHMLTLNKLFEVIFSNASNWHPQKP